MNNQIMTKTDDGCLQRLCLTVETNTTCRAAKKTSATKNHFDMDGYGKLLDFQTFL